MSDPQVQKIALQLSLSEKEVQATIDLLDSGATLPFITRCRKEAAILNSLAKRNLLADDLKRRLLETNTWGKFKNEG